LELGSCCRDEERRKERERKIMQVQSKLVGIGEGGKLALKWADKAMGIQLGQEDGQIVG
jgi:hypothetical protein